MCNVNCSSASHEALGPMSFACASVEEYEDRSVEVLVSNRRVRHHFCSFVAIVVDIIFSHLPNKRIKIILFPIGKIKENNYIGLSVKKSADVVSIHFLALYCCNKRQFDELLVNRNK